VNRRGFLAGAGAAAVWPARAQVKLPVIGFLAANTPAAQSDWTASFVQRLEELGWRDGREVRIEYRWVEGRQERSAALADELVRLGVDIILTHATPNVLAAKRASSAIPVVFAVAGDPVANGLVASLAQPGGNVTGLALQQAELAGKRLGLLREAVPNLRRVAILVTSGNANVVSEAKEVAQAAASSGIDHQVIQARSSEAIMAGLKGLGRAVQALYVPQDPVLNSIRASVAAAAIEERLPTVYSVREHAQAGGLMSYGPNFPDLFRRAADVVDKVLRGARPADLPVQQPTKFDLTVNLRTAKALDLELPPALLARADEVIE
jgi:putative ABC transport system substrate-binding protein